MKQVILLLFFISVFIFTAKSEIHPGDSIQAYHTNTVPVIDGDTADVCWSTTNWHDINYVWIVPGTPPTTAPTSPADLSARYKVLWNKTTNLLYFIFEVTDDVFVNGYVYGNKNTNYPSYDVVEVFLDEDRSGGDHTFSNNAFAYHITGGNSTVEYNAVDMYGVSWSDYNIMNYSNHLPEFTRRFDGKHYFWEFSLMVLKDTYVQAGVNDNPAASKSTLTVGKRMGMSAAVCDNDGLNENPPTRDHFIGSKYIEPANQNDSWWNASLLGSLILADNSVTSNVQNINSANSVKIWIDNARLLNCKMDANWNSPIVRISDISGRIVAEQRMSNDSKIDVSGLNHGCYLIVVSENNHSLNCKIIL